MTRHPPEEPRPTHVPGTGAALRDPLDVLATTALLSGGGERQPQHQRDPELDTRGAGGGGGGVEGTVAAAAASPADGVAPVLEDFVADGWEQEEMETGSEEEGEREAMTELKEGEEQKDGGGAQRDGEEAAAATTAAAAAAAAPTSSSAPVTATATTLEAFKTSLRNASLALAPSFMRPEWEAAGGGKEAWSAALLERGGGGGGAEEEKEEKETEEEKEEELSVLKAVRSCCVH